MSSSDARLTKNSIGLDKLALVRLSRWYQLSPETLQIVKDEIATSLGLNDPKTNAGMREVSSNSATFPEIDQSKLSPQLRHLISAGAPWHVIADLLWQDFNHNPNPLKAARILETAFVQAAPTDTLDIFTRMMSSGLKGFYWYLHPKLRDFIVEHAPEQQLDQLYWIIAREPDETKLTGVELAYIFIRVAMTSDKTAAWMYFRRHRPRIFDAFGTSKHFGLSKQQLIIRAGELALSLGYTEDARELFQLLAQGSAERETALQLLLRFESNMVDRSRNSYFVSVDNTPEWKDRLTLISSFCDTCRKAGAVRDPNRSALDLLLKSILQWLPKSPEAWRSVGELIISHRDLAPSLPGLVKPLLDNAVVFHGPDLDSALWHSASIIQPQNLLERFLHSTAILHKYVTNPRLGEQLLWQAHANIAQADNTATLVPWSWRDLVKTAQQWANNTTLLLDRDRKRVLAALRLAQDGVLSSKETVENYMNHCRHMPDGLLHAIARTAAASGNFQFASNLLVKSGLSQAFTNKDLLNLWNLTSRDESSDLAWRVATVLSAREALPATIKNSWEISGEHRTVYTPIQLTVQDIECAMAELSPSGRRLAQALCILGTKINELAQINGASTQQSPCLTGNSKIEQAIEAALKTTVGIPKPSKSVVESRGIHMIPSEAVPIVQSIISGPWLFSVRLIAERLSIPSWGWSVQVLRELSKSILPLVGRDASSKSSAKMAKWISTMTSSERAAWADIANCSNSESPENLSIELVKFVCRVGVILYPGHLTALKTMQQIRMPLDIIRDLEWFILSEMITTLRTRHNIMTRVAVPGSLKRDFVQ